MIDKPAAINAYCNQTDVTFDLEACLALLTPRNPERLKKKEIDATLIAR